jgi:hypothetical protein
LTQSDLFWWSDCAEVASLRGDLRSGRSGRSVPPHGLHRGLCLSPLFSRAWGPPASDSTAIFSRCPSSCFALCLDCVYFALQFDMMSSTASQLLCRDVSRGVGHGVSLTGGKLSILLTVDFLYTQIVVNFLNVTSWRGVWELHGLWTTVVFQVRLFYPDTHSTISRTPPPIPST